mmetsp:Transcript_29690/g.88083  ORF Transcript_29690/g.88083 Transcript_29690/m.88083 type:complete len:224 (-) Transcript_29690:773-1444(-)
MRQSHRSAAQSNAVCNVDANVPVASNGGRARERSKRSDDNSPGSVSSGGRGGRDNVMCCPMPNRLDRDEARSRSNSPPPACWTLEPPAAVAADRRLRFRLLLHRGRSDRGRSGGTPSGRPWPLFPSWTLLPRGPMTAAEGDSPSPSPSPSPSAVAARRPGDGGAGPSHRHSRRVTSRRSDDPSGRVTGREASVTSEERRSRTDSSSSSARESSSEEESDSSSS